MSRTVFNLTFKLAVWISFCLISMIVYGQDVRDLGNKSLPKTDGPLPVSVAIDINKIYNVNTIDQSYEIDGYLMMSWEDSRLSNVSKEKSDIYWNSEAVELMEKNIWSPAYEFINMLEKEDGADLMIVVKPSGQVIYYERFKAKFHGDMDFKKFPYDNQNFDVLIESFIYSNEEVVFTNLALFPHINDIKKDKTLFHKWRTDNTATFVEDIPYDHLDGLFGEDEGKAEYSRAIFRINAQRMTGYYDWQVLLPLYLIIASAWTVFWLKSQGEQLSIAFTLMLTVVAFNFYTATLLPKLPYNTFIEWIIISGYLSISITIVSVLGQRFFLLNGRVKRKDYMKALRITFPIIYLAAIIIIRIKFLGFDFF